MKCAFSILVALLAALALGAPPGPARRDIVSSTNTYPTDNGHRAELNNLKNWTSLDGTTSGTAGNPGKYGIALRMGPSQQHVGTLRGQRLYDAIFNCLSELQPWDDLTHCQDNHEAPSAGCNNAPCRINNIVYNANVHGTPKYASGAYLEVKMWWPYEKDRRNTKTPRNLRRLTYEIVAASYRKLTEGDVNCYEVNFPGSRATRFCMVPKQFLIAFPTSPDSENVQDVVKIDVKFHGKSEGGKWDCPNSVEPVNGEFLYRYRSRVALYFSWDEHEINPQAMCAPDECLDWYKPNPDGPWKENPKCKLPDFKIHD